MSKRHQLLVVAPIPPELRARLSHDYDLVDKRPEAGAVLPGFSVAVTTSIMGLNSAEMAALPDLELLACNGAGVDKIDLAEAERRGITLQHTPDAVTDDTADTAISLMYATLRRVAEADRFVRAGKWKSERMTPSRRVFNAKLGIAGLGKIGKTIARRASALGMDVSYYGPRKKDDVDYRYYADLAQMAEAVDVLTLACPASPSTEGLVNAEVLRALGPNGYLVNISRGTVVDEEALLDALEAQTIAGAGLDVFLGEPDINPRFFALDNVVLQPHYAAVTTQTRNDMAHLLEQTISAFYKNQGS